LSSYKDLSVYSKSYELSIEIYRKVNACMPQEEMFGLTSQIKRAATSIPLNIAEGYAKIGGRNETIRFLQMARGSCAEMTVLIDMLKDLEYITKTEHKEYAERYDEVGKMLTGLINSITNSKN
jgi:four helix bundle protein